MLLYVEKGRGSKGSSGVRGFVTIVKEGPGGGKRKQTAARREQANNMQGGGVALCGTRELHSRRGGKRPPREENGPSHEGGKQRISGCWGQEKGGAQGMSSNGGRSIAVGGN